MEKTLYILYRILTASKIGKIMLGKTEYEVERYLPFDDYGLGAKVAGVFLKHLGLSFLLFNVSFLFFANKDFKYFFSSMVVSILTYYNCLVTWKRRCEVKLLRQLSLFISEFRHSYYRIEDVEEAFSDSFHLAGEELKLHLGLIEETFENGGIPDRYKVAVPNKYFLVLLSLCQSTLRFGDRNHIFVSNLDELQKNIDSDLLKWDREAYLFHSLFFVMIIPLLFLPIMEHWAVSQIEELGFFYQDIRGSILRGLILILSFPVFLFFLIVKDTNYGVVHPFLSFLVEQPFLNKVLKKVFQSEEIKQSKIITIFNRYFPGSSYLYFLLSRFFCFFITLLFFFWYLWFWNLEIHYFPIFLLLSFGFSFLPYYPLVVRGLYYESELEDEISQVRMMILSLSAVSGITSTDLLLWIESFTTYLKESISECIDELNMDEEAAFKKLRNRWDGTAFVSIVDDLTASDKIGMKEAFLDLSSRREYYIARRRQGGEFITRKKEAILHTFMFFPFMLSVFSYLILPFLYVSFHQLLEVTRSLR